MRSVADDLRRDTYLRVLAMSATERISLALALGDDAVDAYMRAIGCSPVEARRQLAARHRDGRLPSRTASSDR